jgi:AraC-like DNA-binding protein
MPIDVPGAGARNFRKTSGDRQDLARRSAQHLTMTCGFFDGRTHKDASMLARADAVAHSTDRTDPSSVSRRSPNGKGGLPGYRLRRILEYIAAHVSEDLTLDRLAYLVGMSPHHFASMFRQSTGAPPHQFVLLQRVERAKERLCQPGGSILDVALDVGFNNPSHFARTFRRFVGTSPSTFRAQMLVAHRQPHGWGQREGAASWNRMSVDGDSPGRARAVAHPGQIGRE